jgi:lysophospholipase L1-like esterase
MIRNLILSLVVTLITLLCTVLSVELFFYHRRQTSTHWHDPNTQFDPELGWGPVPSQSIIAPGLGKISSNSLGFRSNELDITKKHVILLGDSVTWGYGVSDDETVSSYLEKRLGDLNYQVDNLGVSGYGLDQYYLYLKRHIDKIPNLKKVVLIICTINDLKDAGSNARYGKKKPLFHHQANSLEMPKSKINQFCLKNMTSKSFFLERFERVDKRFAALRMFLNRFSGDETLAAEELNRVAIALIEKMDNLVREHGADFLIVLAPITEDFEAESSEYQWFENLCTTGKYQCLDFTKILKGSITETSDVQKYYRDGDNCHYNKLGNRILAEAIDSYLGLHESEKPFNRVVEHSRK